LRTPKEAGSYSLKITLKEGAPIIWNQTLVAVAKELPPSPVFTKVPDKVEPEESFTIYGKNFFYQKKGDSSRYSNLKEVFFVKDGKEIKALGVSVGSTPGQQDDLSLKAPKNPGSYSLKVTLREGEPILWNSPLISIIEKAPEIAKEERPLFSYTPNGPVAMSSDIQQYVKTTYTYDQYGRLAGAQGQGTFDTKDGFGNKNKGTITQEYKIFNGQAKLTKNSIETTVSYVNGSTDKQNMVTTYTYDSSGKLLSAEGSGTVDSKDSFGDSTKSTVEQTYTVVNGQAKEKDAKVDSKTQNVDGPVKEQKVTTTYQYDSNGKLNAASGNGTFKKDDGFGNTSTGNIVQKYEVAAGQAKLVDSTTTDETTRNIAAEKEEAKETASLPVITKISKTTVEPEEYMTFYGKNFKNPDPSPNAKAFNFKNIEFAKEGSYMWFTALGMNAQWKPGEEQEINLKAPKEEGVYSIKIIAKSDDIISVKDFKITVAIPRPIITSVSKTTVEPEERIFLYGKNFKDSVKEIDFVKEGTSMWLVAMGLGILSSSGSEEQRIGFKAPQEMGIYSIKMTTKADEIITLKEKITVMIPHPPAPSVISASKVEVDPEEMIKFSGNNFTYRKKGDTFNYPNYKDVYFVKNGLETKAKDVSVLVGSAEGTDDLSLRAPKETGSYSLKITLPEGDPILWNKSLISVIKKVPTITSTSKSEVETEEALTLYGKYLIAQDASGFTSMNFSKLFFVKNNQEYRIMAIIGGPKRGEEQSINISAPKEVGSYSLKMEMKSGEIVSWNNMRIDVKLSAKELAKQKALEEEAKKKAEEELAQKKAQEEAAKKKADEELAQKKAQEEAAKKQAEEIAKKKAEEEQTRKLAEEELAKKKAQEELAKKQAEELAKKQVEEDAARQKAIEEAMKKRQEEEAMEKQRQIEKSRVPAEQKPVEQKAEEKKYCNPELPKFWQPGCVEQGKEAPQQKESEDQVPTYSKPKQPAAQKPTQEGAKICDPNVPRYSQPGCMEQ
ncbi:MAG: hypothetical protein HYY62_08790, partial [Deltaproteobacteria bacterium]|nr:hypothetical protein [Deltaproteobacteria bacterium]